VLAPAGVF